jgi:predicted translin family RNA/ssDNA-binding protein
VLADDLVSEEGKGEIQLTSEDYLQGVIGMVNELVRFSFLPYYGFFHSVDQT